jgi:hypothetical protein
MLTNTQQQVIVEKILNLPPDKVTEVENFIDFLLERTPDKQLVTAATKLSETAFKTGLAGLGDFVALGMTD